MNSMARACSMVVNLLFPRGCAGCDKPDEVLCEACRALFSQPTAQSFDGVAMQRWFACGWYRGTVRRAVLAWKDHGDEECDRAFADAICALAKASGVIDFVRDRHGSCHDVVVVPASSSPASIRRRGRKHMMPIAKHLAGFLREETGCEVTVRDALENRGGQREISADQRCGATVATFEGACFGASFGFLAQYDGDSGGRYCHDRCDHAQLRRNDAEGGCYGRDRACFGSHSGGNAEGWPNASMVMHASAVT